MGDRYPKDRLLLIEDHAELSLWIGKALRQQGLDVEFAGRRFAARFAVAIPLRDLAPVTVN